MLCVPLCSSIEAGGRDKQRIDNATLQRISLCVRSVFVQHLANRWRCRLIYGRKAVRARGTVCSIVRQENVGLGKGFWDYSRSNQQYMAKCELKEVFATAPCMVDTPASSLFSSIGTRFLGRAAGSLPPLSFRLAPVLFTNAPK